MSHQCRDLLTPTLVFGKTLESIIKQLICKYHKRAKTIYDEKIMPN